MSLSFSCSLLLSSFLSENKNLFDFVVFGFSVMLFYFRYFIIPCILYGVTQRSNGFGKTVISVISKIKQPQRFFSVALVLCVP